MLDLLALVVPSRLERSRQDLRDPALRHLTVSAVGAWHGLPSPAHFNRAFGAAFGLPPRRYRDAVLYDAEPT